MKNTITLLLAGLLAATTTAATAVTFAAAPAAVAPDAKQPKAKAKAKATIRDQDRVSESARTSHPSSAKPDFVTLTWTGDPSTTQTIRWRTNPAVTTGTLALARADGAPFDLATATKFTAVTQTLATPNITNDPAINFHTVTLTGLEPGTRYIFSAGGGASDDWFWTPPQPFTTAPAPGELAESYSFIYIGDTQGATADWGNMMRDALQKRPGAAFLIVTGDLVNLGRQRNQYDDLFYNARGVFNALPVVPTPGNHDYQGGGPRVFLDYFALRANGPKNIGPGLAYSFEYSDALFVVLDSNRNVKEQAAWLEEQLRGTKATWKFVAYHHPAYNARAGRSNPDAIRYWVPLFDKYHVDIVFQGHDHAYMRTYPMRAGKRVASPKDGTVYLVSYSCPKSYELQKHAYTEVGFENVPTWQVIDITPATRALRFRAYDAAGKLRDEFMIKK